MAPNVIEGEGIRFDYADEITPEQAQDILDHAVKARSDIAARLGKGAPQIRLRINHRTTIPLATGTTVHIPVSRIPRFDPQWRTDPFALHHELTHVIAPAPDELWFLAEGIAVHVQTILGAPAYPNQGEDLHALFIKLQKERGAAIPLLESERYRNQGESATDRRLAYVQEGSFARWLIETQGLEKYHQLLKGKAPQSVYGKSFEQLEIDWRAMLTRLG